MGEVLLPPGVNLSDPADRVAGHGVVVNDTDLPDETVLTYIEEQASVLGVSGGQSSFSSFSNQGGSLLARSKYRVPHGIFEEISLARSLADRDDDVASTIGAMLSLALSEGFQHAHQDETVVSIFDELSREANIAGVMTEMYRELLIASQLTTVTAYVSKPLQFQPSGADRNRTRRIAVPRTGVLPAEQIRVLGNDMFGTGELAFLPGSASQESWLEEFFDPATTAARKAEMRRQDPVLTTLLVAQREISALDQLATSWGDDTDPPLGRFLYLLNPRMVARTTFAKGASRYPRPLLTRNFALLEAKRLLNVMDHALLEGGANFLVVVKKGSDQRPATQPEVENLRETVKRASKSGVMLGDHRLQVDIITPNLEELLNPAKRKLIGQKLSAALLRIPAFAPDEGGEGVKTDVEILSRVVTSDRGLVKRHVEEHIYEEAAKRNGSSLDAAARLWFPKIILQGTQYFTDLVLKLRDRGDIPRQYAVRAAGFDYDAAVQARKREKANGDDRVMTPAAVPFSNAQGGGTIGDNGGGRPRGGSAANGAPGSQPGRSTQDPARPSQPIARNAGETVRAYVDDEVGSWRAGELTHDVLEEYADTAENGRVTPMERRALERIAAGNYRPFTEGPLTVVPVNVDEELGEDTRAVRLATGLSMLVSARFDDAVMARALVFRSPEFRAVEAQELAMRWGFDVGPVAEERVMVAAPAPDPEEHATAPPAAQPPMVVNVHERGPMRRRIIRDEHGNPTGFEDEPVEES